MPELLIHFPHGLEAPIPQIVYLTRKVNDHYWEIADKEEDALADRGHIVPAEHLAPYSESLWRQCELYRLHREAVLRDLADRYRKLPEPVRQIHLLI